MAQMTKQQLLEENERLKEQLRILRLERDTFDVRYIDPDSLPNFLNEVEDRLWEVANEVEEKIEVQRKEVSELQDVSDTVGELARKLRGD